MMKSIMAATAALAVMTTVASAADRPTIVGYGEYSVEAKTFEAGAGAEMFVMDNLMVTPMLIGTAPNSLTDFAFDHAELKANYILTANVDLYGKVKSDKEFRYSEATVGLALQF